MTTNYKVLGQASLGQLALDSSTVKEQVIYEVPANTQFTNSSTSITNTGDSTETYSISVVNNEEKTTSVTNVDYQGVRQDPMWLSTYTLNGVYNTTYYAYSTDGISWTDILLPTDAGTTAIGYGHNKFIIFSYSYPNFVTRHSTDGITWTIYSTNLPSSSYSKINFVNGKFFLLASYNDRLSYSIDGINWTTGSMPYGDYNDLAYGNGKFVATRFNYSNEYAYSSNGINWSVGTFPTNMTGSRVNYAENKFVVSSGNASIYSTDGINWTLTTRPYIPYSIVHQSYGNGTFVLLTSGQAPAYYSTDGITWTQINLPLDGYWHSVTYGDGKFIAVSGLHGKFTSTDGIIWTQHGQSLPNTTALDTSNISYFEAVFGEINVDVTLQQQIPQSLNKHQIIYNKEILAGETHTISGGLTLNSGDQIRAKSASSDIIVNVYGAEIS